MIFAVLALAIVLTVTLTACMGNGIHNDQAWKEVPHPDSTEDNFIPYYDTSLPDFSALEKNNIGLDNKNADGWYTVFVDDFNGTALNQNLTVNATGTEEIWTYSPHAIRSKTNDKNHPEYTSYWCPQMVKVNNGKVEIRTEARANHQCDVCPSSGRFTGGIETRTVVSDDEANNIGTSDKLLFGQAFGYFEATVKFPNAEGLWSAFWLQASTQRYESNEGVDGTEIDVYESAFIKRPNLMGHALLWNGYGSPFSKVDDAILDAEKDLYDGYHTFGLKWTPEYYVFYIDGVATWASNQGGVSKVAEFLRLTVEVDTGNGWGPHGQNIGQFKDNNSVFYIDQVRVFQNADWSKYEIPAENFPGILNPKN